MNWTLFVFCVLGLTRNGLPKQQDGCHKFRLKRGSIINTSQSLTNGADFIAKLFVDSSTECYQECCNRESCSMGLMHYPRKTSRTYASGKKTCFLFNCNYPSVCVFSKHPDYAAIEFIEAKNETPKTTPAAIPSKTSEGCPPGVPVAMCFANPCENAECDAFPSATCKPSYCGGCFAHFYDSNMRKVNCKAAPRPRTEPPSRHVDKTETVTEEVHHHRQWVDNNPNFPTPNWADWGIDGPDIPQRNKGPKTDPHPLHHLSTPGVKTTRPPKLHDDDIKDKLEKFHEKVWKPPTKPAPTKSECPMYKCAANCEVYVYDKSGCRTCQCVIGKMKTSNEQHKMNVTLLVESKDVHVVENSAVVPLIIGLIVSIIMLIVVVVRLKSIKGKLKRRPFVTDDADYLINGMYL